jgi:hypothetical protein
VASNALGLVAGMGAALGIGLVVIGAPPKAPPAVDPAMYVAELDARLREAGTGVHARADTLANLPSLQASVATDAETVRDQTQTELAFRPNKGETITIGQVTKTGVSSVLLVLPGGATAAQHLDRDGQRAEITGGKLTLVEIISVMPKDEARAKELRGALAITQPIDTSVLEQKLDAYNASLHVVADGQAIDLGARPVAAQDRTEPLSLASVPGRTVQATLHSAPPLPEGLPLRPIGIGLAALSLLGVALSLRGGKHDHTVSQVGTAATQPGTASNLGASEIRVGSTISETYEVTKLLGQGGMGAVWEARHMRLPDKRVAIKLLMGDNVQEELFARFRREAEITSKLGHPNIVGVLDFNTLPTGAPYIVLELLLGESLADRLHRGPIGLDQALDIARQIGSALNAAHRAHIVHRDLKPDNVFLVPLETGQEQVKVLDFGISKMRGNVSTRTQESSLLGTPQYMSPEQANGENSKVDARSDVWALGAIVYEMLTGTTAFGGESLAQVVVKIVAQPSPTLFDVPGVPNHVAAAVDKALAKDPAERHQDVGSFIADLTGKRLDTALRNTVD